MPDRVAEQIRGLHARARASSVRDDLTARVLARHGISTATVTGCPAGFLGEEPLRPVGRALVGVPFLPRRMFSSATWLPGKNRSPTHQRRRLMTKLFLGLLAALRAEGLETRVLVHDAGDLDLARRLLGEAFVYDKDPLRMLDAIRECDVIVGFRLHSGIAGLGFGIPPIPVLADGRNFGFAETLGLLELSVPLDPGSVGMAIDRVRLALGSGRGAWSTVIARREALGRTMRQLLERAL
ncbi:MAG TPA: polysaccharide pyruvyl transferase family protein, partial [Thermoanaerobaculia bacterium]|nr:polysaccharide pyruvyl transferase family protein [Thermoanaerobaculia bacterium]